VNDVESLPFDQYQRYRLVSDLVEGVRAAYGKRGPLRILDVGGRTALLRSFLSADDIVLVDPDPSEEPGLVLGDGSRLPFQDRSFDVVAAFDTLEHVPPDQREAFVAECARTSRAYVVLAGPYGSPQVDEAEELLQDFLRGKLDVEHRYLAEHRAHGLPVRASVERQLEALGAHVTSFGHANLDRWLVLMCMEMYMDHDPLLRPLAARFFRFYNRSLYASDHAPPVYRHAVVACQGGAPAPASESGGAGLFGPPVAPADALGSVRELAAELLRFDSEKDAWKPEMERLAGVIGDLEKDLEGHRQVADELRREYWKAEEAAAKIQKELLEARADVDHLVEEIGHRDRQLEALRAELNDRLRNLGRALAPRKKRF